MLKLKYLFRSLIVTVLLSLFSMSLFAQVDTAFWFAVPHLTTEHQHVPITLVVTSFGEAATVTVTKPAASNATVATFTVPANSSHSHVLVQNAAGLSGFECPHNSQCNNGLYIHSTAKITAYVAVQQNNSEIYALKGINGMGTQFFVTSQFQYDNGNGSSSGAYSLARNAIEIISTEDDNAITITPSVACGSHAANVPFTVTLQRGQVYCLAATSQLGSNHICGTIVSSTKPVVVDVSDDSVTPHSTNPNVTTDNGNGSADLVADQLVPESMAGSQYVVVPSPTAVNNVAPAGQGSGDYYLDYAFIFALQDNTNVSVYNNSSVPTTYSMNRGQKQKIHFSSASPIFIYATTEPDPVTGEMSGAPIFVFQVTGAGKEFGGTNLPPINCTGSYDVGYTPLLPANEGHSKKLVVSLICKATDVGGFQFIGNNTTLTASDWHDVPGTFGEFKYCRKQILNYSSPTQAQMTPFRVTNSLGKFHIGIFDINGSYDDCSIGYFSNYAPEEYVHWDTLVTHHDYCEGDTIRFAFDSADIYINSILLPSGTTVNYGTGPDEITEICNVTADQSGYYEVYAAGNCENNVHVDSIYITIHPSVDTTLYDTICPGVEYNGFDNQFYFDAEATAIPGILRDSIRYQTAEFGCDSIVRLELTVRDSVFGEFSKIACNQYSWNGQTYTQSGDYTQTLTGASVHGCDSVVTLHLEIEEPEVTIVTSEDDFCEFGELVLTAETAYEEYIWNTGETTPFISVTQPGLYSVTVTQGECQASDHYTVPTCEFHIYMPSSITPSRSDGLNDYLFLPEYVHRFLTDFQIEIFDRWGELIYWSNDMNFKWYGEKAHVSDVYVWVVRVKNQEGKSFVYRGTVTVL